MEHYSRRYSSSGTLNATTTATPIELGGQGGNNTTEQEAAAEEEEEEDRALRAKLHSERLREVLDQAETERQDFSFSRKCLFCSRFFAAPCNRADILRHMYELHNFSLGHPDNLVFVADCLNDLQFELDSLRCLYCERTFRDHEALRNHMRKKQHIRLNPRNSHWDQYYLINFLEPGRTWQDLANTHDCFVKSSGGSDEHAASPDKLSHSISSDGESFENNTEEEEEDTTNLSKNETASCSEPDVDGEGSWDGWEEDDDAQRKNPELRTECLFCEKWFDTPRITMEHMSSDHGGFSLKQVAKSRHHSNKTDAAPNPVEKNQFEDDLDYGDDDDDDTEAEMWAPQQEGTVHAVIRAINFIRRRVDIECRCPGCPDNQSSEFASREELLQHMSREGHFLVADDAPCWTDPTFLLPVRDNDPLLFSIDDEDDDEDEAGNHQIGGMGTR